MQGLLGVNLFLLQAHHPLVLHHQVLLHPAHPLLVHLLLCVVRTKLTAVMIILAVVMEDSQPALTTNQFVLVAAVYNLLMVMPLLVVVLVMVAATLTLKILYALSVLLYAQTRIRKYLLVVKELLSNVQLVIHLVAGY